MIHGFGRIMILKTVQLDSGRIMMCDITHTIIFALKLNDCVNYCELQNVLITVSVFTFVGRKIFAFKH